MARKMSRCNKRGGGENLGGDESVLVSQRGVNTQWGDEWPAVETLECQSQDSHCRKHYRAPIENPLPHVTQLLR